MSAPVLRPSTVCSSPPTAGETSTHDLVEAIARRVVELLLEGPPTSPTDTLIDAAEVARRFGVDRGWVYQHADELGAVRLGDGPRPRLRFQAEAVKATVTARTNGKRSRAADRPQRRRKSKNRPLATASGCPLLPVRGPGA
jgi:hypothetical protein